MLRVLTFNINGSGTRHGGWKRRKELVRQLLEAADADILALQAVRQEPKEPDQATQLAALLAGDPAAVFEPAARWDDGAADGPAIVSRRSPCDLQRHALSRRAGIEDTLDRVVLFGRFDMPKGWIYVVNAHFSWVELQADDNVRETLSLLDSLSGPVLLVGDMNQSPDAEPMRALRRAGWDDIWTRLHPGEPGYTFESSRPSLRIDYAWANAALSPHVRGIQIVGDCEDDRVRPSDHFGLLVALDLQW